MERHAQVSAAPRLRDVAPADLAALAALRRRAVIAVEAPYTADELAAWADVDLGGLRTAVATGSGAVAIAEVDGALQGFAWVEAGTRPHLRSLYVDPRASRRGVGTLLLRRSEQWVRTQGGRWLFVAASLNAVGFYAACGYASDQPFAVRLDGPSGPLQLAMRKMVRRLD